MLVICTVKIVSFLVIFNPVNFPFFFFSSRKPWAVYCAVHALRYFCSLLTRIPCAIQTLWFFAVLLCKVALQRHSAHTLQRAELLQSTLAEGKSLERLRFTPPSWLFFISGALQRVLPVTSASPRGKSSSNIRCWRQVLSAPVHCMGQEICYSYKKEKQFLWAKCTIPVQHPSS